MSSQDSTGSNAQPILQQSPINVTQKNKRKIEVHFARPAVFKKQGDRCHRTLDF